jgi:hypothetical protein
MIMSSTLMLGDDDDDVTYWLMKKLFDVWHTLLHFKKIKLLHKFAYYKVCSQIWLSLLMDDHKFDYFCKIEKNRHWMDALFLLKLKNR